MEWFYYTSRMANDKVGFLEKTEEIDKKDAYVTARDEFWQILNYLDFLSVPYVLVSEDCYFGNIILYGEAGELREAN